MDLFRILFLALWIGFYGAYLFKNLLLRRRGIRADILGKGGKSSGRAAFERLTKVATYSGAGIQLASVLFPAFVWSFPVFVGMQIGGGIVAALGFSCFVAAMARMGLNWRAGFNAEQDTSLVTGGVYRWSRNPAFLGFDLLYLGWAVAFPNVVNIAFALVGVVLFHLQILGEERFCAEVFGGEYAVYRGVTRRYLGRKKRLMRD